MREQILLIEDEPTLALVLTEVLSDEGYEVESLADGLEALQRLFSQPAPDLVITDINLPGISGKEITEKVRQSSALNAMPIIMITGTPVTLPQGVQGLFFKPFDINTVVAKVSEILGNVG